MPCNLCNEITCSKIFTKDNYNLCKCHKCGLIYVNPLPNKQDLEEFYAKSHDDELYRIFTIAKDIRLNVNKERFQNLSNYLNKGNILDVGCSSGYFLDIALENKFLTYGVEFSERSIEQARLNHENIFKAPLENIKFHDSFFDNVTIFDVIEHVANPNSVIREIARITKKGGILAITTPDQSSHHAKILGRYWYMITPPAHLHLFSQQNMRLMLENNGFKILEIRKNYKILNLRYLFQLSEYFLPQIYPITKILLKILPNRFLEKYRRFFVGEMFVIARKK